MSEDTTMNGIETSGQAMAVAVEWLRAPDESPEAGRALAALRGAGIAPETLQWMADEMRGSRALRKCERVAKKALWGLSMRTSRRTTQSASDELTSYACRQYENSREMAGEDSRERALLLASTVGRHARRLGLTQDEVSKWLQGAYGYVWVRLGNLNPGADLKEIREAVLKAMSAP
jgi:hypothetical protein